MLVFFFFLDFKGGCYHYKVQMLFGELWLFFNLIVSNCIYTSTIKNSHIPFIVHIGIHVWISNVHFLKTSNQTIHTTCITIPKLVQKNLHDYMQHTFCNHCNIVSFKNIFLSHSLSNIN